MTTSQARRVGRILVLAAGVFMPLVLAAPGVCLVKRHTTELRSAEQLLRQEIHRLDNAIKDIADVDRLRHVFATQNVVLEALEPDRPIMLRLLNVLGTLPAGLQLTAAMASGGTVVLAGIASEPPVVTSAIEAMQAGGLDEVEITLRQPLDGTGPGEQFEIRARYDGLSERHGAAVNGWPHGAARALGRIPQ